MAEYTSTFISEFDIARKAWPGVKRGLDEEFENFKKKHRDWKKALSLLKPAIDEQVKRRKINVSASRFVPPWKNFQTWINNRCWTEIEGVTESPEDAAKRKSIEIERYKQKARDEYLDYLNSKTTEALMDLKKDNYWGVLVWLIDEIINNRNECNRQTKKLKNRNS